MSSRGSLGITHFGDCSGARQPTKLIRWRESSFQSSRDPERHSEHEEMHLDIFGMWLFDCRMGETRWNACSS